ncbi:MAG: DUF3971 domain-containing protein [Mangrovicoccus sp.]
MHTLCAVAVVAAVALGLLALIASSRLVPVGPVAERLLERVTTRFVASGAVSAEIGDVYFSLRGTGTPVITASDLVLNLGQAEGRAHLDSAELLLSREALLRGRIAPRALRLSGVSMQLTREPDRDLQLDLGQGRVFRDLDTPGEIFLQLGELLARPEWAQLEAIGIEDVALDFDDPAKGRHWESRDGRITLTRDQDILRLAANFDLPKDGALALVARADTQSGAGTATLRVQGLTSGDLLPPLGPSGAVIDAPVTAVVQARLLPGGETGDLSGELRLGPGEIRPEQAGPSFALRRGLFGFSIGSAHDQAQIDRLILDSDFVSFSGDASLWPNLSDAGAAGLVAQLRLKDLKFAPEFGFAEAVRFDHVTTDLRWDQAQQQLDIGNLAIIAGHTQLQGQGGLSYAGLDPREATLDAAQEGPPQKRPLPKGMQAHLDLQISQLAAPGGLNYWPLAVGPKTRNYLAKNLKSGTVRDLALSWRVGRFGRPAIALSTGFEKAELRITKDLPHLRQANGRVSVQEDRLVVTVDQAQLQPDEQAPIKLGPATVRIDQLKTPGGTVQVQGQLRAEASSLLYLLAKPPFRPVEAEPLKPRSQDVSGQLRASLALQIPRQASPPWRRAEGAWPLKAPLPPETEPSPPKLSFQALAALRDVENASLVKGHQLAARQLRVVASDQAVTISGPLTVDGHPITARWHKPLGQAGQGEDGQSQLQVSGPLTQALAANFGVPLSAQEMSGQGQFSAELALSSAAPPQLDLTGDLAGVRFRLPAVQWWKSPDAPGSLRLSGQLGAAPEFDLLELRSAGLSAKGRLSLADGGKLSELRFDRLQIGSWLDAPVVLRPAASSSAAANKLVNISLPGGKVDLRGLSRKSGTGGGRSPLGTMVLRLDRLILDDSLQLTSLKGQLNGQRKMAGRLSALINGGPAAELELSPAQNGTAIQMRAADGGAVLRAAQILPNLRGGALNLSLIPRPGDGSYRGQLRLRNTALRDAPFVTEVISALSIVGLMEQASGQGIQFGQVDAEFLLTPQALTISKASATGPSLGVSIDGSVNLRQKSLDLQGVVSPIYFLNRIGEGMTRRGEGLFGVTFTVQGGFDAPRVGANPLSLLAPGGLREIFRRAAPQIDGGQ